MTQTRTLTLLLPLPTRPLSPNGSRGTWAKRSTAAADYRERCGWTAVRHLPCDWQPLDRARVSYTFTYCGPQQRDFGCGTRHIWSCRCEYRPKDWDNASAAIKALQDALVDAHAITADDANHLSLAGLDFKRHGARCLGHGGVVVQLTGTAL